jgi:hypothetical protein
MGRLGGIPGLVLGLAGGVLALDGILARRERALTVYLALVPAATAAFFVIGSLLFG